MTYLDRSIFPLIVPMTNLDLECLDEILIACIWLIGLMGCSPCMLCASNFLGPHWCSMKEGSNQHLCDWLYWILRNQVGWPSHYSWNEYAPQLLHFVRWFFPSIVPQLLITHTRSFSFSVFFIFKPKDSLTTINVIARVCRAAWGWQWAGSGQVFEDPYPASKFGPPTWPTPFC